MLMKLTIDVGVANVPLHPLWLRYWLQQGYTTQISWRAKFFFDIYKGQSWYVLRHSKRVLSNKEATINLVFTSASTTTKTKKKIIICLTLYYFYFPLFKKIIFLQSNVICYFLAYKSNYLFFASSIDLYFLKFTKKS